MTIDTLARRFKHAVSRGQFTDWRKMYTGRRTADGVTLAGADSGKVWVRAEEDSREETQVWGSANRVNLPVWVGPNMAGELAIQDLEQAEAQLTAGAGAAASLLPPITPESQASVLIGGRQFQPGRLRLSALGGMYVYVEPFHADGLYWPGGDFLMTPTATASNKSWCAVVLRPSAGTLAQVTGTDTPLPVPDSEFDLAALALVEGDIPVGALVLENGQTDITGEETWADFRYHFAQAGGNITGMVLTAPDSDTRNLVQPTGDHPAIVLKNNAAQADNIFEHHSSAGSTLTSIAPTGNLTAPALTATGAITGASLDINGDGTIRKLLTDASTELTIASGAVTATQTFHRIDTEADAASDDLATINGGTDGQFLVLRAEHTAREVVLTTAGNITTGDGNSVALDELYKFVLLIYDGNRSKWNVVGSGGSGGGGGSYYQTVKDNGTAKTQRAALNLVGGTDITLTIADDGANNETDVTIAYSGSGSGSTPYSLCQGRLTLTSGTPVTTADVTAVTTLYFTPYKGNQIGLYNGSSWEMKTFGELSLSLSGYTANANYDIWAYNNAGTVTLESTVWTNDTTRATALTTQDGVYVKTGATTRRYLGTIRMTGTTGQTEDSVTKRYVWNYTNRAIRPLRKAGSGSWTYSTATYRQANNSTSNQVAVVTGVAESGISLSLTVTAQSSAVTQLRHLAIGEDSTSTPMSNAQESTSYTAAADYEQMKVSAATTVPVGYHYYAWLERGNGSGTQSWYGGGSGFANGLVGAIDA